MKEKNGAIKMIKLPLEKGKNNSNFRKNKDIYLEIDNEEMAPKHKKKKRKTLYEVLENRKKQSLGSIRNISLKDTIESVIVEKNFNKTRYIEEEKQTTNNN